MHYLLLGLSLGVSAGLSPGPLMTLVITTSLRDGFWHGLRVAVAPFLSDLPIILLTVFVLERLPAWTLGAVGVVGGLYVVYLGWETVRSAGAASLSQLRHLNATAPPSGRRSLLQGALVNLLNPHPYLFWATVGGPTLLQAYAQRPVDAAAFLAGFYSLLVGSKVAVAALVASQSHQLSDRWYRRGLVALGALLVVLGLLIAWQALRG
jgi:threonine/homoserine/homoserine lactone efflux protein